MKALIFFSAIFLAASICQAKPSLEYSESSGEPEQSRQNDPPQVQIPGGNSFNRQQIDFLKHHFDIYSAVVAKKLGSAEPSTIMRFNSTLQRMHDTLTTLEPSEVQSEDIYRELEGLVAEIGDDPVLMMAYIEALQSQEKTLLATITPDKGHGASYAQGESILFQVTAFKDCYIQVFFLSPESDTPPSQALMPVLLYPEKEKGSARIKAGQTITLGERNSYMVQQPYGNDLVIVIASENELPPPSLNKNHRIPTPLHLKGFFTDIHDKKNTIPFSVNSSFFASQPPGKTVTLLTEQEAESLRLSETEWKRPPLAYRSIMAGPVIKIHEPAISDKNNPTIKAITPMNLKITFEEKNAPVDMNTLEVTAMKGFFSKKITERVRQHISGTALDAKNIDFPTGKFRIQVDIADVKGIATSREYRLEVK